MSTFYFTDMLLRPARVTAEAHTDNAAAASEVSRILLQGAAAGEVVEPESAYIATIVSARTGLNEADARERIDTVLGQIDAAKVKAQEAPDTARKAAARTALVGAFIASAAAALGGKQRDDEDDLLTARHL